MLLPPRLWRIEPDVEHAADSVALAQDLRRYVRDGPLTTILITIDGHQRAYLQSPGCAGCRQGRCDPGCRIQLLRRVLRADHAVDDLLPVAYGLTTRPYRRLALALPGRAARPLDESLITRYQEARLAVVWQMFAGRSVAGASLAVGMDGPDPALVLRSSGWRV